MSRDSAARSTLYEKLLVDYDQMFPPVGDVAAGVARWIDCGDGWHHLIDGLLGCIDWYATIDPGVQRPIIVRIKEKHGTLRIQFRRPPTWLMAMAAYAEELSTRTCEVCGAIGQQHQGGRRQAGRPPTNLKP
mgnify:CR=1 FL=1